MKAPTEEPASNESSCVFVVDDDDTLRAMLAETLNKAGFATQAFQSADEFISHFDPRRTCCLLLDLNLPGTSGLELQRWLSERGVRIPIVFLTGAADVPTAVEAMRAGAVDFLEKPVDRSLLIERIGAALALEKRWREAESSIESNRRKIERLTKRELEICTQLIEGLSSKEIARKLGISTRTVEHHRANVLRKLGVANAVELARTFLAARADVAQSSQRSP